jgi:tripartite-type tricarboxylate transporter receptor subunit TctC
LPAFPDVPTMTELGYSGFDIRDWQGVVAPADTPRGIIAKMAGEITRIVALPEVRERLATMGMYAVDRDGPDEFGALIRSEIARWGKIVREAGIRAD